MDPKYSNPRFTGWREVKSCRKHLVQKQRKIFGELKTVKFLVKWIQKTPTPDLQAGESKKSSRKAAVQKQRKIFGELDTVKFLDQWIQNTPTPDLQAGEW